MIHRSGDLFSTERINIGHGVNCRGVMGAGIALQFKSTYPEMFMQYKELCSRGLLVPGSVHTFPTVDGKNIFNLATQSIPGPYATLEAILLSTAQAAMVIRTLPDPTLAIPKIGCGIGGLNWPEVEDVLVRVEYTYNIQFEVWTL